MTVTLPVASGLSLAPQGLTFFIRKNRCVGLKILTWAHTVQLRREAHGADGNSSLPIACWAGAAARPSADALRMVSYLIDKIIQQGGSHYYLFPK